MPSILGKDEKKQKTRTHVSKTEWQFDLVRGGNEPDIRHELLRIDSRSLEFSNV